MREVAELVFVEVLGPLNVLGIIMTPYCVPPVAGVLGERRPPFGRSGMPEMA